MLRCFEVQEGGELIEIQIALEDTKSTSIYFFVDYNRRMIYLWKGKKTGFRMTFAGAKAATKLQKEFGPEFEVQPIDEGAEPYEFTAIFR